MTRPAEFPGSRRAGAAWALAFALFAVLWAVLRLHFGEEYRHAPWADLVELGAPLPFGHRVLVPLVVRGPVAAGVPIPWAFGVVEALAAFALLWVTAVALSERRRPVVAGGLALALLSLLTLVYVVPRTWPIFYPWDTPALLVVVAAVVAVKRRRWGITLALAVLGALNRESALLLPAIVVALHDPDDPDVRGLLARAAGLLGVVLLVRLGISLVLEANLGPPLHFTVHGRYRLLENLGWLADPSHARAAFTGGGFALLAWAGWGRRAGWPWRRLGLVAAIWAAAAMLVANASEPRAFGEAIVLALLVSMLGPPPHDDAPRPRWLRHVDRYGSWLVLAALLGLAAVLSRWSILPVAQWPMPR